MAFNKAKEERKWKQWKEKEEALLRTLGMDEESILELRSSDWEEFKAERRYQNHRALFPEYQDWESIADEQEVNHTSSFECQSEPYGGSRLQMEDNSFVSQILFL